MERTKVAGCDDFLHKAYRTDQGFWYEELVLPKKQLLYNNQ